MMFRYRTLFNSIDEGFCSIERISASDGTGGDYLYIAANPALKTQSGVTRPPPNSDCGGQQG